MPKCFLPSSLISHWKTICLFHKNEADQAFFVLTIIVLSFSFLFSFRTAVQILNLIFWIKVRTTTVFWPVWGPTDVVLIFIQSFICAALWNNPISQKWQNSSLLSLLYPFPFFSGYSKMTKKRTRFNWRVSAKGGVKTKCEVVEGYQTWTSARVSSKRDRVQKGGVKT